MDAKLRPIPFCYPTLPYHERISWKSESLLAVDAFTQSSFFSDLHVTVFEKTPTIYPISSYVMSNHLL